MSMTRIWKPPKTLNLGPRWAQHPSLISNEAIQSLARMWGKITCQTLLLIISTP